MRKSRLRKVIDWWANYARSVREEKQALEAEVEQLKADLKKKVS